MQDPLTGQVIPGSWRSDTFISALSPLEVPLFGHNVSTWAKKVRETFNDYFVNEGAVSWQWDV